MRQLESKDVVKVTSGKMEGKTGVIVRTNDESVCVVLTNVWDHGIWFSKSEVKRIGRTK